MVDTRRPTDCISLDALVATGRLAVQPLPWAWAPHRFAAALPRETRRLRQLIDEADHLQFAIGGLWGDWGALATLLAQRMGRRCAVWTDRVESSVMAFHAQSLPQPKRLYHQMTARLARHYERYVIRRADMGLFHGMDTYTAYAGYSRDPQLVHDIHLGPEARISPEDIADKQARSSAEPVKIIYAGRAHVEKGILHWIETLRLLHERGIRFEAQWLGDGPAREEAARLIAASGLGDVVTMAGACDHAEAITRIRAADLFLFCHLTQESPRCLIEALISGAPIVGYDSFYARDLISHHQGGMLTTAEPTELAACVAALASDRAALGELQARAAQDGFYMVDEEVFRHRSDLIKSLATRSPQG